MEAWFTFNFTSDRLLNISFALIGRLDPLRGDMYVPAWPKESYFDPNKEPYPWVYSFEASNYFWVNDLQPMIMVVYVYADGISYYSQNVTIEPEPTQPALNLSVSANSTIGDLPLVTKFQSIISGGYPPYSYDWNFGDEVHSNLTNPMHVYESSGRFYAVLTITDRYDKHVSNPIYIDAIAPVNASFTIVRLSFLQPSEVRFLPLVSGGNGSYSFLWAFGDGQFSTDPSPQHRYADSGPHDVILTVTDLNSRVAHSESIVEASDATLWLTLAAIALAIGFYVALGLYIENRFKNVESAPTKGPTQSIPLWLKQKVPYIVTARNLRILGALIGVISIFGIPWILGLDYYDYSPSTVFYVNFNFSQWWQGISMDAVFNVGISLFAIGTLACFLIYQAIVVPIIGLTCMTFAMSGPSGGGPYIFYFTTGYYVAWLSVIIIAVSMVMWLIAKRRK